MCARLADDDSALAIAAADRVVVELPSGESVPGAVGTELPMGLEKRGVEVPADWVRGIPPALQDHLHQNGLDPKGPMDAHGERIYMMDGPETAAEET